MIETEIIKQVTLGNYKSYTMKIVQQEDSTIFYNLTIEDRDGIESMFVTQYIPTEYWLNNVDEEFRGGISSIKINKLTVYTEPELIFDDLLNNGHQLGIGVGGGGGSTYSLQDGSPTYPTGCNGYVIMSMKSVPYPCGCENHMPWECNSCPENPAGYTDIPYYYCMEFPNMSGNNPDNPDNSSPGGTTIPDVPEDLSIAAMIKPEECSERIVGDLNRDCMLSPYESCLLSGNSIEVCDCVEAGGNLSDCLEEEDCNQLKELSTKPGFTSKMNELKNNLTGTKEKGFLMRDVSNDEFSNVFEGDDNGNIPYPILEQTDEQLFNTYGTAHNHLNNNPDHIGIFTPADLGPLFACGNILTSPNNPQQQQTAEKAVTFVITNKGFFSLKIKDINKLKAFVDDYKTWSEKELNEYLEETFQNPIKYNITPTATREQQITGFLRFIQDQDIGVELYEGNSTSFSEWKKMSLVNNGNGNFSVNEEPCN